MFRSVAPNPRPFASREGLGPPTLVHLQVVKGWGATLVHLQVVKGWGGAPTLVNEEAAPKS